MGRAVDKERYKIIYVDDVNTSLLTLKRRLSGYHEVYPAESADMLFKALEKIKPDIILLDINMPDHDGYEIIEKLKKDERYKYIPVIFITSQHDRDSVVRGLTFGAVDFIVKPFETMSLIECIERHVTDSRSGKNKEDNNKPHILAIDDVVSELKIIKTALHSNYNVHTISKPETVMAFLKIRRADLIILDYLMPVYNGFELIEMIRKTPDYKDIPIIMLTSAGTVDQVKEAIALGACDFMVKPFKDSELIEKVAKYLKTPV
ncbi:MAG: response regulator [Treponema sp.]|nr:response regulator [Treponema sp.]MCL2238165.1 response regulator [Treponema sp.]